MPSVPDALKGSHRGSLSPRPSVPKAEFAHRSLSPQNRSLFPTEKSPSLSESVPDFSHQFQVVGAMRTLRGRVALDKEFAEESRTRLTCRMRSIFDYKVPFKPHSLGDPINNSPHSVCVHLPRMADVIGYEEKDPAVLAAIQGGYPRFFRNPILKELAEALANDGIVSPDALLLADKSAGLALCEFAKLPAEGLHDHGSFFSVSLGNAKESRSRAEAFLQHTGSGLSSREAEAILQSSYGRTPFGEGRRTATRKDNLTFIQDHLHQVYGTASPQDIFLFRSGMNAFYAGYSAIQALQAKRGRTLWIQLGWLYVDTVRILEKVNASDKPPFKVRSVVDLHELNEVLREHGSLVAGIVAEVPTNPLVETPDLETLLRLARRHGVALILDPTLASPHNVHILPYTDIHVNSLTKYAAADGDIMMGALALNPASPFYDDIRPLLSGYGSAPGDGDLARMAFQIPHYGKTIATINATTPVVAAFLENHPSVAHVHWAYQQPAAYNYRWLQHRANGPGGIISFVLKGDLAHFYDRCNFVKSPSFGARFTMLCPFLYLAHYDLVRDEAGRRTLSEQGLHPDLLRLSIGLEPASAIIEELNRCL